MLSKMFLYNRVGVFGFYITLLLFIALGILTLWVKRAKTKHKEEIDVEKEKFKLSAQKITFQFDDVKITSHMSTTWEPASKHWHWKEMNSQSYDSTDKIKIVLELSYLECVYNNEKFKSEDISIDRKNLEIKIFMNQGVNVYYNKTTGDYLFDLKFLEQ